MILCLDVGNSQIYGGIFDDDSKLKLSFRKGSKANSSSDELGLFLKGVMRENEIDPKKIHHVAVCSVVPALDHTIRNCSKKYFGLTPFFLQAGVKTGFKIKYRNPVEVGADRIANSIAAAHFFPNKDIIVVDFGTATTFCVLSKDKEYLGGVIIAGIRTSMEALDAKTAKLPLVEILAPQESLGRSTVESIQSGLYYGNIGMVREITTRLTSEAFKATPIIIGTGGFSSLFEKEKLFDRIIPDLVLQGLNLSLRLNI